MVEHTNSNELTFSAAAEKIEKVVKRQYLGVEKTCACALTGAQHHDTPNSKHPGANLSLNLNQFSHIFF